MEEQKRKRAKLFSLKYLFHDFVKITATLPGLLWFRPKYVYKSAAAKKKARGGVMVIANHISKVDPVYDWYAFTAVGIPASAFFAVILGLIVFGITVFLWKLNAIGHSKSK